MAVVSRAEVKIAIVGAGAMGSLFACLLHRAGHSACLLDKDRERVEAIKQGGLILEDAGGSSIHAIPTVTADPHDIGAADLVMVFVKSYDTEEALRGALPLFHDGTVVLTLQNGLNNLETITGVRGGRYLLGGTTAHGATLFGHGRVRHAGCGETVIGAFAGDAAAEAAAVAELLTRAGIKTTVTGELTTTLWRKLIINAAINPLTALTRLANGEITAHPGLMNIQQYIVCEACEVARAQGLTIDPAGALAAVRDVCSATASNKSSMLQDIMSGRRTEIDYINGAIVAAGAACHMPTPYNSILTRLVKALEAQFLSREAMHREV